MTLSTSPIATTMCTSVPTCLSHNASPLSRNSRPTTKRKRAAAQKIDELTNLEHRLIAASIRSQQSGHVRRANSYLRQANAVRRERESWTVLANNPTPPAPLPHLFGAVLCVILPVVDLFVAGGNAAKRLSRVVFTIGVIICGIVLGTSSSHSWSGDVVEMHRPEHWVTEIASRELSRKGSNTPFTRLIR